MEGIYDMHLLSYYNLTSERISELNFPEIQCFEHVGVCNTIAGDFDNTLLQDCSDALSYFSFHHKEAYRNNKLWEVTRSLTTL